MTAIGRLPSKVVAYSRRFFSSARHDGPLSAHFDGKKFSNEIPTRNWAGNVLKWLARRKADAWPEWIDAAPAVSPPTRVGDGDLRITFINHSTVLIQAAGLNLLTDPVWSPRVGPFPWLGAARVREPGLSIDQVPAIDAILLSHDHYDHLDVWSLRTFLERDRPRLICGLGVDRTLAIDGLAGGEALDWWESVTLSPSVRATFTPSRHFSGRGLYDQDSTLWGSFVISTPAGPVYFGGDTGYGPHFKAAYERFGPMTAALLPIGCYEPRWFMETFHMSPADAVRAHLDLKAETSVGIHYGTFQLGDESYDRPGLDLGAALQANAVPAKAFIVPEFGAEVVLRTGVARAVAR